MREAFEIFDKNGNGTIDKSEFQMVMNVLGFNPTDAEVEVYLTAADLSGM